MKEGILDIQLMKGPVSDGNHGDKLAHRCNFSQWKEGICIVKSENMGVGCARGERTVMMQGRTEARDAIWAADFAYGLSFL